MKVAHVNYLPTYLPGIQNRIINQAQACLEQKINIDFFILNPELEVNKKNIKYRKINFSKFFIIRYIQQKLYRYKIIESLVPFENYDYIILRYPLAMGIGMKSFYMKWGQRVITEHHTIEEYEIKYYFNSKLLSMLCSFVERKYKNYISKKTIGMIGVTNEIVKRNLRPLNEKIVITNGIDVSALKKTSRPKFNNTLNMIFVASRFAVWHGLDKLIQAADKYNGPVNVRINVVGSIFNKSLKKKLQSFNSKWVTFQCLGSRNKQELEQLYSDTHLAVSSLGLDRIGLEEGCVIKTREYIAKSIPFIYSYRDCDLSGEEVFAYRVSKDADKISFIKIIQFYLNLQSVDYEHIMNDFTAKKINLEIKVKEMWDFINKIDNSQ